MSRPEARDTSLSRPGLRSGIGVTPRGQPRGGEINDRACNDGMDAMILMYHFTQDARYLDAFVRCADWFLAAQLGPPTYGWAQQYDADNNPVWARVHEPPATCIGAGRLAYAALRQAWWMTGDRKYLDAPKKFFEWMRTASRNGTLYTYYDPKTGRAIVADKRKIYALDDPAQVAAFSKVSVKISYARPRKYNPAGDLARIEEYLKSGRPTAGAPADLAAVAAGLPAQADVVRSIVEKQNEAGAWVRRGQGELRASGPVVWINQANVRRLLTYVEQARMLIGELPNEYRGRGALLRCAYPHADWYDTPLRPGRK